MQIGPRKHLAVMNSSGHSRKFSINAAGMFRGRVGKPPGRVDLIPVFRTSPSMISDEGKGKEDVEEQAHGSGDDRGVETDRGWT